MVLALLAVGFGARQVLAMQKVTPLPAPQNASATRGDYGGITLSWDAVGGVATYGIALYAGLGTQNPIATFSLPGDTTSYLLEQPCGYSAYFQVQANQPGNPGDYSPRFFGQTIRCNEASQNCDFAVTPLSGTGTYYSTTLDNSRDFNVGDREKPCSDGSEPGVAGAGRDLVYTYRSPVDCNLKITLQPEAVFDAILYVAETCDATACDYYSNEGAGLETVSVPIKAKQDYYIFVDGVGFNALGEFELTLLSDDCLPAPTCAPMQLDFEEGAIPADWQVGSYDTVVPDGNPNYAFETWNVIEDLTGVYYNKVLASFAPTNEEKAVDDWLVSGPITLGEDAVLRWRDARFGPGGTATYQVYVAKSGEPQEIFSDNPLDEVGNNEIKTTFNNRELSLAASGFANQTIYIAFRNISSQAGYLLLDDIGICGTITPLARHSADQDGNNTIDLSELLRVIQLFNSGALQCASPPASTEDGYAPGTGNQSCAPYAADYDPQDWTISLSELLRIIQFYNSGGLHPCPDNDPPSEDGYCPGPPPQS